ncbi:MAG: PQQ-dependent sugar dehydrogenase [Saprospiraceae bacterium]
MNVRNFFCLIIGLVLFQCKNETSTSSTTSAPDLVATEATFKKLCSSCHGDNGDVFVDRKWKHGNNKDSIMISIKNGYVALGMPSWTAVLKDNEVSSMADYLLKAIDHRKAFDFTDSVKSNIFTQAGMTVKLDTIAKGLGNPWGMTFLPNGDFIYTDRNGKMYRQSKGVQTMITGVPPVQTEGQGGLLDVQIHPKFTTNSLIYFTYSKFKDSLSTTALMRAKLTGNTLSNQKDIYVAEPWKTTKIHYGSRIAFDKDGFLFLSSSDRFQHKDTLPQKLDNDLGKVHRMNDDGSAPKDNPFVNTSGARATIWSYGHRNIQGLFIHPLTGVLWAHEHGPRGGDELNIIEKGKNYGWPTISYGINYDGKVMTPYTSKEGMEQPLVKWIPSIAPSGLTIVTGDKYPAWKGDILMGSLRFKYLDRVHLNGNVPGEQEALLKNIGRMRFVVMGPDGYIYVGVEDPGFIFRLLPTDKLPQ